MIHGHENVPWVVVADDDGSATRLLAERGIRGLLPVQPNHYVDATPFVDKKIEAIRHHRSQLADGPPAWIYEWMRQVGRKPGYEYAEHFRRIEIG